MNLDFLSKAKLTFPHGNSKSEEHTLEVGRGLAAAVCLVELTMTFPCFPVSCSFGGAHCCSANFCPRSVVKTLDFSHSGNVTRFYTWPCGKGNAESKDEANATSYKCDWAGANLDNAFDGRDAMSAITFLAPGTWMVITGPQWTLWIM